MAKLAGSWNVQGPANISSDGLHYQRCFLLIHLQPVQPLPPLQDLPEEVDQLGVLAEVVGWSLLLSDVTKIFLFRSRLRFSTLPSLSMSISLCFADAN